MTTNNRANEFATDARKVKIGEAIPNPFPDLPVEPLVIIQPRQAFSFATLKELWQYRELLYFLIWRDLKVRYKQTVLGVAWVVLQPLLTTVVFTVFLGLLIKVPSDGVPYPLFAFAGLLLWTFFSGALTSSSGSIVGNSHLITKIYFPRTLIPIASILSRFVDFFVGLIFLVGLLLYYRVGLKGTLITVPITLTLLLLLSLGVGVWMAALNVRYRDVGVAIPVFLQLGMFVSPVAYSANLVPTNWRWLYNLNPIVGIIENFRAGLFGRWPNWETLTISTVFTFGLLAFGWYAFWKLENSLSDTV
jgi:lipopolysaccharide transport system permease protein